MVAIASNGTGGGNYSAGASWAGGVAPGLGDTAQVLNGDTITIDAGFTVGDDTATPAMDILNGGALDWDNAGSDTCTFRGDVYVRTGGTLTLDGTVNGANILIWEFNDSAALANGKYGLVVEDNGIVDVDGFDKTRAWDMLSANATAGQLNVVTTNDNSAIWNVGDAFIVGSMSENTKTGAETDTIGAFAGTTITKAGANYAFAHEQNVAFCNLTRNIIFTDSNTAFRSFIQITNNTPGNVDFAWCAFEYIGSNLANKWGIIITIADYADFSYCIWLSGQRQISNGALTIDNCILASGVDRALSSLNSGSMTNSVIIGCDNAPSSGVQLTVYTGCHFANADGQYIGSGAAAQYADCKFYGNGGRIRLAAVATLTDCTFDGEFGLNVVGAITRFIDCTFGTQVPNTADVPQCDSIAIATGVNTMVLDVTVTTSIDNRFSAEDTSNNHKTWKVAGEYEKQNTVVRTGTWAMLMSPSSAADPLIASSTVPAENGIQIVVSAYTRKNAAYGGANLPFLRLSGKGMTTDTDTMTDVDDTWQLLTVSGTPTSDGFALVEFVSQSAGVGAAAYWDDVKMVYTAIDTGSMDFWFEGDTPTVLMSTGLGAVDVWDVLLTQISTPASIGTLLETNVDQVLTTMESNIRGADNDDLKDISDEIATITVDNAAIADAVWDELSAGHTDAGKAGQQLWTDVDAILADTGELQGDWTNDGRLDLILDAIKAQTDLLPGSPSTLTAAQVWAYVTRTLTQSAAQIQDIVEGSMITVYQYSQWTFSITGLGDISDRSRLYFTAKEDLDSDDDEAATIVQLEETDGLLYIDGTAATNAALGTLTVDNETLGNISGIVDGSVTGIDAPKLGLYDVRQITVAGVALPPLTISDFRVKSSITKAVV